MSQLTADSFIAEINSSEEFRGLLRFLSLMYKRILVNRAASPLKNKELLDPTQRGVTTERSGGRPQTDVGDNQLDMEKCGEDNQSWIFFNGTHSPLALKLRRLWHFTSI